VEEFVIFDGIVAPKTCHSELREESAFASVLEDSRSLARLGMTLSDSATLSDADKSR
jgi:hypothetical protein